MGHNISPIFFDTIVAPCSAVIEGDFVFKGLEQSNHSSQEKDLEYDKYYVLLIR